MFFSTFNLRQDEIILISLGQKTSKQVKFRIKSYFLINLIRHYYFIFQLRMKTHSRNQIQIGNIKKSELLMKINYLLHFNYKMLGYWCDDAT